MKTTRFSSIIKPMRMTGIVLLTGKNIFKKIGGKYDTDVVLSFPRMLHMGCAAKDEESAAGDHDINITFRKSESIFLIAANFGAANTYSLSRKALRLAYLSEDIFRSCAALSRLTQALWSIYKSNDLQLSHSLFSLIWAIGEKKETGLEAYFNELPDVITVQKRMIGILKSIDYSLFSRLRSIYGNNTLVLNVGKREIHRYTDAVNRSYGKSVPETFRITENIYSMTPLLLRIYEEIETGAYLYNADNYRNAKTLWRLTNSLWKVYLGQNMELSRSFSRLITRVHQENKSTELRNAENNLFSDNRSLKNLVNALRRAFSGSNLELRNSMISLFSDIHHAGKRKSIAVRNDYDQRTTIGITLLHREIVPESVHTRLDYRTPARSDRTEQTRGYEHLEREIKDKLSRIGTTTSPSPCAKDPEEIARDVLNLVNKKQHLDWRLEKLQRGMF